MAKGYLPISLITKLKLQESLTLVEETLTKTNPDYEIVIKRLHLYYDMKLVTSALTGKKFNPSVPNICATVYTTTINFISTKSIKKVLYVP